MRAAAPPTRNSGGSDYDGLWWTTLEEEGARARYSASTGRSVRTAAARPGWLPPRRSACRRRSVLPASTAPWSGSRSAPRGTGRATAGHHAGMARRARDPCSLAWTCSPSRSHARRSPVSTHTRSRFPPAPAGGARASTGGRSGGRDGAQRNDIRCRWNCHAAELPCFSTRTGSTVAFIPLNCSRRCS